MAARLYEPQGVNVAWFGLLSLEEGFAQGTFIREVRAAPSVTYKPDGMGSAITMIGANFTGQLVLTMDRESRQHTQLMALANLDKVTHSVVGPMSVRDSNSKLLQLYNAARISVEPPYQAGTGPSVALWTFIYKVSVGQQFGGDHNLIQPSTAPPFSGLAP
jgi:hypothetical protein